MPLTTSSTSSSRSSVADTSVSGMATISVPGPGLSAAATARYVGAPPPPVVVVKNVGPSFDDELDPGRFLGQTGRWPALVSYPKNFQTSGAPEPLRTSA